jgi:hypothetical protein
MDPEHMRDATYIGVGGVGIGTKLHYVTDGAVGEIDPDLVRQALKTRKESSEAICGRSAGQLAQLDWSYADGTLPPELGKLRHELFESLSARLGMIDEEGHKSTAVSKEVDARLVGLLQRIAEALASKEAEASADQLVGGRARHASSQTGASGGNTTLDLTFEDPVVSWAYRFLDGNAATEAHVDPERRRLAAKLHSLLQAGDIDGLRRLYPL